MYMFLYIHGTAFIRPRIYVYVHRTAFIRPYVYVHRMALIRPRLQGESFEYVDVSLGEWHSADLDRPGLVRILNHEP